MVIYSVLCALVQGISEAFPVSSSFHFVLLSYGMNQAIVPSKAMAATLHSGSFLALCLMFRQDIGALFRGGLAAVFQKKHPSGTLLEDHHHCENEKAFFMTMIAAGLGLSMGMILLYGCKKWFFPTWNPSLTAMSVISIVFALLLEYANRWQNKRVHLEPWQFSQRHSLIIGFTQSLAAGCSGVSRLGITLTAGRFLGYSLDSTCRYSFVMGIPIIGASVVQSWPEIINMGFLTFVQTSLLTFLCSWPMIKVMLHLSKKESTLPFTLYRVLLGFLILWLQLSSF
jgi:undecaprenyl-diphosphatase